MITKFQNSAGTLEYQGRSDNLQYNKKGGYIHIKKQNRGKFTESAKRAGKSVQEHARDVVNDPKATKLQKRRAQFALNAKKFKHQEGGILNNIVNWVNSHNVNFVNRLKDPNREAMIDWENPSRISTHKMSVGTDKNRNTYIYPNIQEIDGKLVDFTRPPYNKWAGMVSAEERGDTVHVVDIGKGLLFTQNYKNYYPNFRKSDDKLTYLKLF